MDYFALFELLNICCLDWLDLAPKRPGGAIFKIVSHPGNLV